MDVEYYVSDVDLSETDDEKEPILQPYDDPYKDIDKLYTVYSFIRDFCEQNSLNICSELKAIDIVNFFMN